MIYKKKHSWCTIEDGLNIDYEMECDTHLLFMGNNMFGELLPKCVTKLGSIPNLLLSTPPIQKLTTPVSTEMDITKGTDPAEFPNSVPDQTSLIAATSRESMEDPNYDGNLDTVLLASSKGTQNKGICPVHPQCSVNKNDSTPTPPAETAATSIMLLVLKWQCNVSLLQLSDEQLQHWIPSQDKPSSSSDILSTDSEDNMLLSELTKLIKQDDGFTTEDDIPLCDLNKPRMRSSTHKTPKVESENRFPRKSKDEVSYAESELCEAGSENSSIRKK